MNQLYYTSCQSARSVSGASGLQIRATSTELGGARARVAVRYAGYALPADATPGENYDGISPVRLAYLATRDVGYLVCHSVHLGRDPMTLRGGNFFSHLLLDLPEGFDAADAVQCWDHPFWRTSDGAFDTQIVGDPPAIPDDEHVPWPRDAVRRFLQDSKQASLIRFCLSAIFMDKHAQRIFLAADPGNVAMCLYAISRVLPAAMRRDLTFSTFEQNPRTCEAKVVATCWLRPGRQDLPEACYSGSSVGYNAYTGRSSPVPPQSYAASVVELLACGHDNVLAEVVRTAEGLGISGGGELDLIFRLEVGEGNISRQDLDVLLHRPKIARWFLTRPDAADQVLAVVLADPASSQGLLQRVIIAANGAPAFVAACIGRARALGIDAIRANDVKRARAAVDLIRPMISHEQWPLLWRGLLEHFPEPSSLPWEARACLLTGYATAQVSAQPPADTVTAPPEVAAWLLIPGARIPQVLAGDLPEAYKTSMLIQCLRQERSVEVAAAAVPWLVGQPNLLWRIMADVADISGGTLSAALFHAVLDRERQSQLIFHLLHRAKDLPRNVVDACILRQLDRGAIKAGDLVDAEGARLTTFLGRVVIERLTAQLLAVADAGESAQLPNIDFLKAATNSKGLSAATRARAVAWVALASFLRGDSDAQEDLSGLAESLATVPDRGRAAIAAPLLTAVGAALFHAAADGSAERALPALVAILAPAIGQSPENLFRNLLHWAQGYSSFWSSAGLLSAFLAVALGHKDTSDNPAQTERRHAPARGA